MGCLHRGEVHDRSDVVFETLCIDEMILTSVPQCPVCFSRNKRWAVNMDDAHNPWRFITCPDCCGTGHNLDASVRIA